MAQGKFPATFFGGGGGGGGASLTPSATTFLTSVSSGALIAALSHPFGGGETYATVGTVPGQLALSSGNVVAGATAAVGGTGYALKVRVTSSDGKRELAETLTFTAQGAAAAVPAAPTFSLAAGNAQVTLSWTDNGDGGSAITGHKLYRGTTSGGEVLVGTISGASPYIDGSLTNAATYFYRLSAVNSIGESPLAAEQSKTPFAPLQISGTPAATGTTGSAYNFAPATSGGYGAKTFALTGTLPGGLSFSTTTGAISGTMSATGTFSGLNITVTDSSGSASLGVFSIAVSAAASVPDQVTGLAATPGNGQVALTWTAPAANGSAITDYVVYFRTGAAAFAVFNDGVSTATSATVTGLVNGTSYDFQVAAVNGVGTGAVSAVASKAPVAPSASALVPQNWEFLAYGDSRTENGMAGASSNAHGYAAWIGPCSGGRVRQCSNANFGISVSKISQGAKVPRQDYQGNVTAASTAKGADKAALETAGIVVFRYGTNDTDVELTSTDQADTLTILNNLRSNQLKVLVTENACGWNILGQAQNPKSSAALKSFRDWMLTLDYASGSPNARSDVIVIDYWPILYDAANDRNKQGYLRDGKHDSIWGALQFGNAFHARMTTVFGSTYTGLPVNATLPVTNGASIAADAVGVHAPYVHTNPTLVPGTNGSVQGSNWRTAPLASGIPAGWGVQSSGTGAAIDIVSDKTSEVDPDGYPVWKLTLSGTLADQQSFQLQMYAQAQATGRTVAVGDKLRTVMRRKIDPGTKGLNGVRSLFSLLNSNAASENRSMQQMGYSTGGGATDRIGYDISTPAQLAGQGFDFDAGRGNWEWLVSGVLSTSDMTAITSVSLVGYINLANYTGASLDVSAVVRISRFGVYKEA